MQVALRYDLRTPDLGTPPHEIYAAFLEQCAWADDHGFDRIRLHEHHGTEDGYLPSPFAAAAAVAARTTRIRIRLSVVVIALHDPLRVAEDAAVVDLLSGGRLELTLGLGYVEQEYVMFGRDFATRARGLEEAVPVLRRAWTGEPFEYRGVLVRVTPRPAQRPGPPIFIGGTVDASGRRAARLGDGFEPAVGNKGEAAYRETCEQLGRDPGPSLPARLPLPFLHVAEDPERVWQAVGPHATHEMNSYGRMQAQNARPLFAPVGEDLARVRESGLFRIVTPDECVELLRPLGPTGEVTFHPLMAGLDPALAWESLELFASKVLPRLP